MSTENKTAIIAITVNGKKLSEKLRNLLGDCDIYYIRKGLSDLVREIFPRYDNIVFIMATGIVVRVIAPYVQDKLYDPAVLVMDDQGKNIISLLSGHIGGANELTHKIAELIGANPVVTTATDVNEKSALDMIAKKLNAHIDNFRESVKDVNSYLVNNESVGVYIDGDYDIDLRGFEVLNTNKINAENYCDSLANGENIVNVDSLNIKKIVVISDRKNIDIKICKEDSVESVDVDIIKVVPKDIVVGIGCRKNISTELMYDSFIEFLNTNNIDINSISKIGSIELKKDEKAIQNLSNRLEIPFITFSQNEISKIDSKYEKSDFVKKNVGVNSVSEPVAHLLSDGNLIVGKHKYSGITFALGRIKL